MSQKLEKKLRKTTTSILQYEAETFILNIYKKNPTLIPRFLWVKIVDYVLHR